VKYNWNWGVLFQAEPGGTGTYLNYLLVGLGWSIVTALCAWVIALVVGSLVGTLRTTGNPWVVRLGNAYVEIFRNIPLIVQMFLWFFTGAYVAEIVRAGIEAVPRGQMEAARSLGMSYAQAMRHVILPQAFRIILPPLTSEFMNIIKNSSVALTIGLLELTGRARAMQEMTFQVFEAFAAATTLYLITNLIVVLGMRLIERKVRVPGLIAAGGAPMAGH